ncbi:LysR family transcriptional regulator [Paraburkholderia sp.]|uniref:LysR family transcriptional regulator n=1 Tax=Paraburkholderia sp. TaxID=1926495 RepID=UPI0025D0472B|nr:LysR family transcriptional regulator [Paraburkholderia sp.]
MVPSERLKGIEAFVTAADAGSFTSAAERLNLTNSAVGKSVARLEARLGTRLFNRTTRKLSLTDAGEAFYETCVRVLGELQDAEAMLAAQKKEPVGRVRVDVPVSFGHRIALPSLLDFSERHPNLRLHVSFSDRFIDLADEDVDLAIRIGGDNGQHPSLSQRYLGREKVIFCASPEYLHRNGSPESVNDLFKHRHIVYEKQDGSISPWIFPRNSGEVKRRSLQGEMIIGHGEALLAAALGGHGIAQLATWLIEDDLKTSKLIEVLPDFSTDGLELNIVWPKRRKLSPKVDALITFLTPSLKIR